MMTSSCTESTVYGVRIRGGGRPRPPARRSRADARPGGRGRPPPRLFCRASDQFQRLLARALPRKLRGARAAALRERRAQRIIREHAPQLLLELARIVRIEVQRGIAAD